MIIKTFYVKPVVCHCCVRIIKEEMEKNNINLVHIAAGDVTLAYDENAFNETEIEKLFNNNGFQVIKNQEKIFVDRIKNTVADLIQYTENKNASFIENLVDKLDCSFSFLSSIFAKYENLSLYEFIEKHKIEKAKYYLKSGELSVCEIAHTLEYPYSTDFEKIFYNYEGIKISDFIKNPKISNQFLIDI